MTTEAFTRESPSIASALYMKLATLLVKKASARDKEAVRDHTWVQSLMRLVWHLAGFSSLTTAGFMWDMIAGFIVLGISCFVMSTLTTGQSSNSQPPMRQNRRG